MLATPSPIDALSYTMSKTAISSPSPPPPPLPLGSFTPYTHIIRSDVFSRFVVIDGRVEVGGIL